MEKTICGDATLSKADEDLAKAYDAALKPLSPDAQEVTRAGEKAWLGFARQVCHLDGTALRQQDGSANPSACLLDLYGDRTQALASASPHAGPYQFYTRYAFKASPAEPGSGMEYGETRKEHATYQIDRPASDDERAWNDHMADLSTMHSKIDCDQQSHNESLTPRLDGAFPDVISVTLLADVYCGGAHDNFEQIASTRLLHLRQDLKAEDVFKGPASSWQPFLQQATFAALLDGIRQDNPDVKDNPMAIASARDLKLTASSWTIQPKGLGIQFQPYELGAYALGAPQIVIPWDKLKPYLNRNGPIKLPPQ